MQSRVLEIFQELAKIPHCSFKTQAMKDYICKKVAPFGATQTDKSGNILVAVGSRGRICLQAHYDMVCVNTDGKVSLDLSGDVLKARGSSLGADNGIGVAMMLALIEENTSGYYLFTNDEEVGMIGAKGLELDIPVEYFLNLDEEREGIITIGCAGGFDACFEAEFEPKSSKDLDYYALSLDGYPGGHSGINIQKVVPHPLKDLLYFAATKAKRLVSVSAGEKRNAIPTQARIEIGVKKGQKLKHSTIKIEKIQAPRASFSKKILNVLGAFPHGVLGWLDEFSLPQKSVNFALVDFNGGVLKVVCTYRAMDDLSLENLQQDAKFLAKTAGLSLRVEHFYNSWSEAKGAYLQRLKELYAGAELKQIHAGLECACLKQKFPKASFAAIGPNIYNPHTASEYAQISSITRFETLVRKIMTDFA